MSCQNLIVNLVPTSNWMWQTKDGQSQPIDLHKLTPWGPITGREHQPPPSQPYFAPITLLHKACRSFPNLQNHFPNKALLKLLKLLIAKPPEWREMKTVAHFTRWVFLTSPIPLQGKFHWSCSIQFATSTEIGKREKISWKIGQSALNKSNFTSFWELQSFPTC